MLRLKTRLSSSGYFLGMSSTVLFVMLFVPVAGGETTLCVCVVGSLGIWFTIGLGAGFFSSSPSYFQLFLFLLGDGLVSLVFLSALRRF